MKTLVAGVVATTPGIDITALERTAVTMATTVETPVVATASTSVAPGPRSDAAHALEIG